MGDAQAHELTDLSSQMGEPESPSNTGDDQAHELLNLSPDLMALHQRIAALEAIIIRKETVATITPWRLVNTVVVLGVGAYKAVTTYLGQTTGPTTADWIIGVAWALMCVCVFSSRRY
ncbi:hypothetical protein B0H13DRAFT_2344090 [Mycena leptocephala]|nr:hypothetical protein B0H13DRAFT_2344090 [Mycena leptocephala]